MLALDRPYIASSQESAIEESNGLCLEYGSATQLFMVPLIQLEEQVSRISFCEIESIYLRYEVSFYVAQVCITLTQNWCQGTGLLSTFDLTPGPKVSQVSLPRDSQGSLDFSTYPFQVSLSSILHPSSLMCYRDLFIYFLRATSTFCKGCMMHHHLCLEYSYPASKPLDVIRTSTY